MRNQATKLHRTRFISLIVAILGGFSTLSSAALAGPSGDGRNREELRDHRQVERQGERARDDRPAQDAQRQGQQIQVQQQQQAQQGVPYGGRRNGHMSVEERRALRQQIDQAGHDFYKQQH